MCVVFLCGVRDISVGLHQKEDFIQPERGWHQVVMAIKVVVCKFKRSITKISLLGACRPFVDNGLVKMYLKEVHP